MPARCDIVKVGSHAVGVVQPPNNQVWKITALIAKALDFGVRVGNALDATGLILEADYNLSTSIFIDHNTYLIFDNKSSKEKIGFYSAEIS